jgi:carbon-monoxide dehydrogenase medium subunit
MQVPAPFTYERATSTRSNYSPSTAPRPGWSPVATVSSRWMKLRLARPDALIDINDLADLSYVRIEGDRLLIGALTRHAELLASPVAGEHYPIFHDAERVIADRSCATSARSAARCARPIHPRT